MASLANLLQCSKKKDVYGTRRSAEETARIIVMKHVVIIANTRDCRIDILHHDADQSTWIVRRWKKFLWFKNRISSDWFSDERQATRFAHTLKEAHLVQ